MPETVNNVKEVDNNGIENGSSDTNDVAGSSLKNVVNGSYYADILNGQTPKRQGLKRNESFGRSFPAEGAEARVLVIYTGGTIGMMRNKDNVLQPMPNTLVKNLRKYPDMHDQIYAENRIGIKGNMGPLVLPPVQNQPRRIIYTITEYDPLLDSSNMTINEWVRIAEDIKDSYQYYDGFVILHGTDTLSYTASALSFMLENLGKTIIITGSQIPIFETRTDGKDNFTSALILAGNYVIPEVCVVFGTKLLRGNRTIKVSSEQLDAFDTPNICPLAKIGINVEVDYRAIFRPCTVEKFNVHSKLDENVGILRIFPSVSVATFRAFLQPPMKGVVLQSFGAGNVPSNRQDLMKQLKCAVDSGVIIINCTQCTTGSVSDIYETGSILSELGVLPGFDMTPEAALTKLAYVLGKDDWDLEVKKQMMLTNLRGELSSNKSPEMDAVDIIDAVARTLRLSSPKELSHLGETLFPAIVNSTVLTGDIHKIDHLKSYGADLAGANYDRRTALHIAASEGNFEIVRYLLLHGVSVHFRDRHDRTPLMEAISIDHHDIIRLLVKCGAHLTGSSRALGEQLCAAALRGCVKRLESFRLAGADLSQSDPSGRTALHLAALHSHNKVVKFLLESHVDKNQKDMLDLTPLDYALKGCNEEAIQLLK